jgi:hypothetical protein
MSTMPLSRMSWRADTGSPPGTPFYGHLSVSFGPCPQQCARQSPGCRTARSALIDELIYGQAFLSECDRYDAVTGLDGSFRPGVAGA